MNDIDVVIIWVDGNDVEWQKQKEQYQKNDNGDGRDIRFRDWDNVQFIFRGIEQYMPFVRDVFFVTCGHFPKWLDKNNPRLHLVKHEDFIPKEYLPTFSSHTIELNLHRIKGLSEKFIYFNDDLFVVKKCKESYFFRNDLPVRVAALDAYAFKSTWKSYVGAACVSIINDHFNKKQVIIKNWKKWFCLRYGMCLYKTIVLLPWKYFTGIKHSHLPEPYIKSTFYELWEIEHDKLDATCKHKFRTGTDVNQWLVGYWEIVTNKFNPGKIRGKSIYIHNEKDALNCRRVFKNSYMIAINDSCESYEVFEKCESIINGYLYELLPNKSSFEL